MTNLLRGHFFRMFRNKLFYALCGLSVLISCGFLYGCVSEPFPGDIALFQHACALPFLCAVFTVFFIGRDYSDGAIRAKFMAGHTRTEIFLSAAAASASAGLIFFAAGLVPQITLGFLLLGFPKLSAVKIFIFAAAIAGEIVCLSAIFSALAFLIHSKAVNAVLSLALIIAMYMGGSNIQSRLNLPEYVYDVHSFEMQSDGSYEERFIDQMKTPGYISGARRFAYEEFLYANPICQIYELCICACENPAVVIAFSAIETVIIAAVGNAIFKVKNIK